MPLIAKMNAYLVGTAGLQGYFHGSYGVPVGQEAPVGYRSPATVSQTGRKSLSVFGVTPQGSVDRALGSETAPGVDQSQISPEHRMSLKLGSQMLVRSIVFRCHNQTTRIAIQTMYNTRSERSPYSGKIATVMEQAVYERSIGVSV